MLTQKNQIEQIDRHWLKQINQIRLGVASPETILNASKGEVENDGTLQNKSLKPMDHGLFCERIFGPVRDWSCSCGNYDGSKHPEHRGKICPRCGVEVLPAGVRRERMGHINLVVPVAHIWFLGKSPAIALFLNLTQKDLESVIYYNGWLVMDPKATPLQPNQVLPASPDDDQEHAISYFRAVELYGAGAFEAKMGAEAIHDALTRMDLALEIDAIQEARARTSDKQKLKKLGRRCQMFQTFLANGVRPEWMVLKVLPVLPAGLRPPIIDAGKGKYQTSIQTRSPEVEKACKELTAIFPNDYPKKAPAFDPIGISDLNELYSRVIRQNERLKSLLKETETEDGTNLNLEKRKLQEAVDALLLGRRRGLLPTGNQLESLSERLSGKSGLFRWNLLGKRVDFSGRSVIVVGPELKLHQCGLPKKMALVLFEPFIIHHLKKLGLVKTIAEGKEWIQRRPPEIWELLEQIMRQRLVLLNRAPTLHRLSIQAFEPILIEGEAIRLHPLTCPAYNADFDGDQMAVHVPLSDEALNEARRLMMSTNNILSPASGKPIVTPSQDIVLGCFYLTLEPRQSPPLILFKLPLFGSMEEVLMVSGYWSVKKPGRRLTTHDWIRLANPDFGRTTIFGDATKKIIITTVGRVLFNEIWPSELGFYNQPVKKNELSNLIWKCHQSFSPALVVTMLDRLKEVGFQAATRAGISIGIDDMLIPAEKETVIAEAQTRVNTITKYHQQGVITDCERTEQIQAVWHQCSTQVKKLVVGALKNSQGQAPPNPLWLMLSSGARGNEQQIVQLTGMRGLMVKANGEVMEKPILANFREGLSVSDFFSSCHGARKGTSDTSLKTAGAGYLTRKLVSVAADVVITTNDCCTNQSRELVFVRPSAESPDEFSKRIGLMLVGRFAAKAVNSPPDSKTVLVAAGHEIDEAVVGVLSRNDEVRVQIRSVLTCECQRGVCAQCYGRDLSTGKPVGLGSAVGVIAAQSISEPGTQLTMRTFHTGGVASDHGDITGGLPRVNAIFEAQRPKPAAAFTKIGGVISYENNNRGKPLLMVTNASGEREGHKVPPKTRVLVTDGGTVAPGQRLTEGQRDPHDFLSKFGALTFMEQLVDEVQKIFQLQGVSIHQKHFEIIARQMTSKVRITEPGDTGFILDGLVNRADYQEKNAWVLSNSGQPAEAAPILLGISQAALKSDGFLSAASFQYTTKILAEGAVLSKRDDLLGMKEKVMTGGLIPAGTGFKSP